MMEISRKLALALGVAAAIPATFAIAATVQHAAWHQMTPETRARLDEGRLAMIKTALKLSPEQEKLWSPVEAQVRDGFKARDANRAEHDKMRAEHDRLRAEHDKMRAERDAKDASIDEAKRPDMAERFDKMSAKMTERADRMKAFAGAFKPLYASLNDEQKDVLRPLIRNLVPGMGHKGHGHRFAEGWGGKGGWGGGWGHGGRGDHHGHGHDGDRGSPTMDSGSGGGAAGGQAAPKAPQNAPDMDGSDDDQAPVRHENL